MSQAIIYNNSSPIPPGTFVQTLTGNTGGPVPPDAAGNIDIIGVGAIEVAGTPGSNLLDISLTGVIPDSFPTDSGTATPSAGILNVLGGTAGRDINTSGSGNTIHIDLNNAITLGDLTSIVGGIALTVTTGNIRLFAGNITLPIGNSAGTVGIINIVGTRFIHAFGTSNSFFGQNSGNTTLTTATLNTALGEADLHSLTIGIGNTAGGNNVFPNITSGSFNSGYGYNCGNALVSGSYNLLLGTASGNNYTGGESSNLLLNNAGVLGESNVMRIGSTGAGNQQVNKTYLAGVDGVNVGSVAKVLTMASEQVGTATITAGAGIVVTPGANTITIATIGAGLTWSVITVNQTAVIDNGYFCNKAGTLALLLPATSAVGDTFEVSNINTATGTQITQAAGQQIFIGNINTTLGATGTLTSIAVGDALKLVCSAANTTWRVVAGWGNWTPA